MSDPLQPLPRPDHAGLLAQLRAIVGDEHVLVDPDRRATYEVDWTGRWRGEALAVVRPASEADAALVVRACVASAVAVVPQGGRTGLVGGGVPVDGGVVVSTERLDGVRAVSPAGTVVVGAGATLAAVQRAAEAAGWQLGVDLAARESATVGGMVATDAGGVRVVGFGSMRSHVRDVAIVLADGRLVTAGDPPPELAGAGLLAAIVGSEGTLGVITTVELQLDRPVEVAATLLVGVAGVEALGAAVRGVLDAASAAGARVLACEVMTDDGVALVSQVLGRPPPTARRAPGWLLVDLAPPADGELASLVAAVAAATGDDDPVMATSPSGRRRLWELRERHTEAVASVERPVKLDVAVPVAQLGALLARVDAVVTAACGADADATRTICWGHGAEGRLHVNVLGAAEHEEPVTAAVYALVAELRGSVVSEHGAGRAKLPYLGLTAEADALAAAHERKRALDPDGLMNPGVRLPDGRAGHS